MATAPIPESRIAARMAIVEEHVGYENQHDLDAVIGTFGQTARYEDSPWGEQYHGRDQVRLFYQQLMIAVPDLHIEVLRRHTSFWK